MILSRCVRLLASLAPLGLAVLAGAQNYVAWGRATAGELTPPAGLGDAKIALGPAHGAAALPDGSVVCWGDDTSGQTDVPAGLRNVAGVAPGWTNTVAWRKDGTVVAWGRSYAPVPAGLRGVVQATGSGYGNLALRGDGAVVYWGARTFPNDPATPIGMEPPAGLRNVAQIAQ